jgi:hypothetical protein
MAARSISVYLQNPAAGHTELVTPHHSLYGKISAQQTVTLTNIGDDALNITQDALTGSEPQYFMIASDACAGTSVPPAGNCAIRSRFTFASGGNGEVGANLSITDNAVSQSPDRQPSELLHALAAGPTKLDFGKRQGAYHQPEPGH